MKELAESNPLDILIKILAGVILAAVLWLGQWLLRKMAAWAVVTFPPWWKSSAKLARARAAVDDRGPGLWLTKAHDRQRPERIKSLQNLNKLILTIANLKGGVGKTTLTANLAGFFANPLKDPARPSRRVLVIDLDFQGSCSSMLFAGTEWKPNENQMSHASELIRGSLGRLGLIGQPVTDVHLARGISAFYDLAAVENREMIRWLIEDEKEDIRYRLADLLLSDAVLNNFDVILIDAPPRLTTASLQALCASTHVLIPTVLDPLSIDAVGYFARQLQIHEQLWPHLKVMGVVGTLTDRRQKDDEEARLRGAGDLLRTLRSAGGQLRYVQDKGTPFEFPYECSIRRSSPVARAASAGVPYVSYAGSDRGRLIRAMFDDFGQEVVRRWQL